MKRWICIIGWLIMGIPLAGAQEQTAGGFRHGKLSNGLTYYIRYTAWKPGSADFYLVQNVGALMEDDEQNGLAHVLEHMAFNGTENFPAGVQYFLKRNGVTRFNAYTGQDETVYQMDGVPTTDRMLVDSCLLVMRDWSGFLLLRPGEMEKERNVILEERRTTRGVGERIREQSDPCIYNHSKYATHNVIGNLEVLNHFTREELSRYYKDFYRPDQQAVIVVGDVDVERVEQEILRLFNAIPKRVNPKPRLVYEIPDHDEPLYSVAIDPEVDAPMITLMKRVKVVPAESLEEMLKHNILKLFYNKLIAKRLSAYVERESPAFTGTSVNYGSLTRGYDAFNIMVKPIIGEDREALREVLQELEVIRRFGFTEKEFAEQVQNYRRDLDETEKVKDKMSNDVYVKICQNNFLKGKPLVSVEEDIALSRNILSRLTLSDVVKWSERWSTGDKNWVFLLAGKDANYPFLTRDEMRSLLENVRKGEVQKHDYTLKAEPLMDFEVPRGVIVKVKVIKALGAEVWTLRNGCKVYYKYSDVERGNVNLLGESYGGTSVLGAEDLPSAEALGSMVLRSGLYHHSNAMMGEIIKGHNASVHLRLGETNESVSGACAREDAEMMFQMIYLLFQQPRFDRGDFNKFVKLSMMEQANAKGNVMDSVNEVVQCDRLIASPRRWKVNEQFFNAMNYDRMVAIYKDRFQDASDFTFYLVGGLPEAQARSLVEHYLGAIPSIYRKEHYQVHDLQRKGSFTRDVEATIPDEKYIVNLEFNGNMKCSERDALCLEMLRMILQDRCQKEIREGQGGTYGVAVEASHSDFPINRQFFGVSFQTSLAKGPEMRALVRQEVEALGTKPIEEDEVDDLKLLMKRGMVNPEKGKSNSFWMDALRTYVDYGKVELSSEGVEKALAGISGKKLQAFARKFFEQADCFDIVVKSRK